MRETSNEQFEADFPQIFITFNKFIHLIQFLDRNKDIFKYPHDILSYLLHKFTF